MKNLRHKMRGVGGLRHNHTSIHLNGTIRASNGITQTVEKNYIFGSNLYFTAPVEAICQKLTRFVDTFCRRIGERIIIFNGSYQQLFHPLGNFFSLLHRVTDIFPDNFHPHFFELVGNKHNIADLISQPAAAAGNFKAHKPPNSL